MNERLRFHLFVYDEFRKKKPAESNVQKKKTLMTSKRFNLVM